MPQVLNPYVSVLLPPTPRGAVEAKLRTAAAAHCRPGTTLASGGAPPPTTPGCCNFESGPPLVPAAQSCCLHPGLEVQKGAARGVLRGGAERVASAGRGGACSRQLLGLVERTRAPPWWPAAWLASAHWERCCTSRAACSSCLGRWVLLQSDAVAARLHPAAAAAAAAVPPPAASRQPPCPAVPRPQASVKVAHAIVDSTGLPSTWAVPRGHPNPPLW